MRKNLDTTTKGAKKNKPALVNWENDVQTILLIQRFVKLRST